MPKSDLSDRLTDFVEDNFTKQRLFTHSLHPTNVLLYELWRYILQHLSINVDDQEYAFTEELLHLWKNPLTSKMIEDLGIQFTEVADDQFYIDRYNEKAPTLFNNL